MLFSKVRLHSYSTVEEAVLLGQRGGFALGVVRVMSGTARELFEASLKDGDTSGTIRARWLRLTVCDDDGNLLFTDADIPVLAQLDADVLIPVFAAALRINGMAPESVEQAEKN